MVYFALKRSQMAKSNELEVREILYTVSIFMHPCPPACLIIRSVQGGSNNESSEAL